MTEVNKTTNKNSTNESENIKVELLGRDFLELIKVNDHFEINIVGCREMHKLIGDFVKKNGLADRGVKDWPLPQGNTHSEILVRELILRANGQWKLPYDQEELCHCRTVLTVTVDQAIISGAHTPEKVSRLTSASTACGTCRPDVEKLLEYRLKK